ncbi:hypothetical protein H0H87_005447 [Tephrocybe sp. NHM501043]|nr:hypothetical protein H0H87_005447 [Tephrocybe sp. NHM501043]
MFSSIFSTSPPVDPNAQNLHPVSDAFKENELFGELTPQDTEWTCAAGFATETQIFYVAADDGTTFMVQVIHSAVGLWYPTIQFVFKFHDPKTKETVFKSIKVNNFVTPPPGLDKRSSKADEFSITYKHTPGSDHPESYTVLANLAEDLQVSLDIQRPAVVPGWKVGNGPKGGFSYFGPDPEKAEGYAIHRFWPHCKALGHVVRSGRVATYQGASMMVQAIQGMRPNLLAASWNFGNFQSEEHGGVSAIQMEFKTCNSHGRKGAGSGGVWVNVGSLVVGGKLASVTAETKWPGEPASETVVSRTTHLNPVLDEDTGYNMPRQILWEWQAPSILADAPGSLKAKLHVDLGDLDSPKGLIEKVDVLAEIPTVVKMASLVGPRTKVATFHSTPRQQGAPLIPFFAAILKASTSLELARTAARIVLTFMPVIVLTNAKSKRKLKWAALRGAPKSEETVARVLKGIRHRKYFLYLLLLVPSAIFWGTIVASLEQTPLTGRWRMIILSPEEEEEIAKQLAGPGWYRAVSEILEHDGPPKIIPNTDWRYAWVNSTMRKLEGTIPILTNEPASYKCWFDECQDHPPMPPPASFPLRPRPRASEYIRCWCDNMSEGKWGVPHPKTPHSIAGPPYSLIIVDKPDSSNAFSYGFGPDGGGGIVVYSGFLDEVLARTPMNENLPEKEKKTWFSTLFGGYFSSPPPRHPTPTPEQTSELAILLAHELSHLILSHHLESLSSTTVIVPGTISILTDVVRVILFPLTMLFGPFVNDAVAQLGKVGSGELVNVGELCTSVRQEMEADVVSARLLAHAGFDARDAVKFWEVRTENLAKCSNEKEPAPSSQEHLVRKIMSSTHPVNELRIKALRDEIARWETERQRVVSASGSTGTTAG